ncbi:hypothetical protein [uncultured Methanolobus sp.]|uniref:hypothetical protein n=1 Tax=uncultured Methanolobus sp. TaxID=218300 RepID=UPI0029C91293|nr:hypothetical protein [uncultured Methanolobus sp.]
MIEVEVKSFNTGAKINVHVNIDENDIESRECLGDHLHEYVRYHDPLIRYMLKNIDFKGDMNEFSNKIIQNSLNCDTGKMDDKSIMCKLITDLVGQMFYQMEQTQPAQ